MDNQANQNYPDAALVDDLIDDLPFPPEHPETAAQKRERMTLVVAFSTFLAERMIDAVSETELRWPDAAMASAMAMRTLGDVAAMMTANTDGTPQYTPEQTRGMLETIFAKALTLPMRAVLVRDQAEEDAFVASLNTGVH